jgi:hypothetical protein
MICEMKRSGDLSATPKDGIEALHLGTVGGGWRGRCSVPCVRRMKIKIRARRRTRMTGTPSMTGKAVPPWMAETTTWRAR